VPLWLWPLLVSFALVLFGCGSSPPAEKLDSRTPVDGVEDPLPQSSADPEFETYVEATDYVRRTYSGESIDTSRSSWITSAEYFEANGRGYLILGMRGHEYIFAGVPSRVWEGFKAAPSFGQYYHAEIRGRYRLELKGGYR